MSRREVLSSALGVLVAVGIIGGVALFLGYFAYRAGLGMTAQPDVTVVAGDAVPPTAAVAPVSADLPPVPVEVIFPYRHLSDGGYIAHIHNTSDKMVRLALIMDSNAAPRSETAALDIPAGATLELGWDRSTKLEAGDRVTATSDGYQAITWTVPGELVSR